MSISVDDHALHIEHLLTGLHKISDVESVALADALGRVTAHRISSPVSLPLFRNSQMDGFAVRAADVASVPVTLPVVADIPAGSGRPHPVGQGEAVRIMTGAIVPDGADCVVPVEHTASADRRRDPKLLGATVTIEVLHAPGDYVREPGSDIHAGQLLVEARQRLAPRHLAALAAVGLTTVEVVRRVRVAVITTGAELSTNPGDGQIFDANLVALSSAVVEAGAEVVFAESANDDHAVFEAVLNRATEQADVVLTSGGVSKGAFEVVREVLEPLGSRVVNVRMQPGGPQATTTVRGVPVISFPGNPVSSQVSFVVFVRPILRRAAEFGAEREERGILSAALDSVVGKRQFLRGRRDPGGVVEVVGGAGSHLVAMMARADVLVDVPEAASRIDGGHDVRVWSL